ncbi:hypothetical protein [Streptomyces himastatinicus]|nr:hypothetical protein [Streptomyces himastatinicus]
MVKDTDCTRDTEQTPNTQTPQNTPVGAVRTLRTLREALRHGGDALPAALREADDGLLLSTLDAGLPADRATRVVVELVRRAPERGPRLADAVCEKVLIAHFYLDQPGGSGRLRVRNALMLYEGLVRPYADRGARPRADGVRAARAVGGGRRRGARGGAPYRRHPAGHRLRGEGLEGAVRGPGRGVPGA